jgi:hypothetical protein
MANQKQMGLGFFALALLLVWSAESSACWRKKSYCADGYGAVANNPTATSPAAPPSTAAVAPVKECRPGYVPVDCINEVFEAVPKELAIGCVLPEMVGGPCGPIGQQPMRHRAVATGGEPQLYPMVCDCHTHTWRLAHWWERPHGDLPKDFLGMRCCPPGHVWGACVHGVWARVPGSHPGAQCVPRCLIGTQCGGAPGTPAGGKFGCRSCGGCLGKQASTSPYLVTRAHTALVTTPMVATPLGSALDGAVKWAYATNSPYGGVAKKYCWCCTDQGWKRCEELDGPCPDLFRVVTDSPNPPSVECIMCAYAARRQFMGGRGQ